MICPVLDGLAAVAAGQEHHERELRPAGASAHLCEARNEQAEPLEVAELQAATEAALAALGEVAARSCWSADGSTTQEQAVAYALKEDRI